MHVQGERMNSLIEDADIMLAKNNLKSAWDALVDISDRLLDEDVVDDHIDTATLYVEKAMHELRKRNR